MLIFLYFYIFVQRISMYADKDQVFQVFLTPYDI